MTGVSSAMGLNVISAIRSLEGNTLGDVYKNFFTYLITNNDAITSNIEYILASFVPENNLEKFFRIKLIDKWRRKSELARIFEMEDIFYVSLALKCKWYFNNDEIDPNVFVNESLPNLSYFTRLKLIKQYTKYLKDCKKAEEIFKALRQRYGSIAFNILPACSSEFVYTTLQCSIAQLNRKLISLLFKYHPDVITDFFCFALAHKASGNRMYQNFKLDNYEDTLKLIATYYPGRFIDMYAKYSDHFHYMKLGKKTTKRLVKVLSTLVIKHYRKLKEVLDEETVIKYMSSIQIEKLQATCFPESLIDFFQLGWQVEELGRITSRLEEEERQQIFLRNFKKCYGKEFNTEDFAKVIDLNLVLLLPTEMRIKWIRSKLPTLEPDREKAEYLSYLPPDIALTQLKEMIGRQTDVMVRAEMVTFMLKSAIRYKKTHKPLLDCISFVVRRLRNDNIVVRVKLLTEICREKDIKDILLDMSLEEWSTIDEFIDLVRMNDEVQNFPFDFVALLSLRIQRYYTVGRSMDDEVKKFLKFVFSVNTFYDFDLCKGTTYRKQCLEIFLSTFTTVAFETKEDKDEALAKLFRTLCDYNQSFKNDRIDFPEWLLIEVQKFLLSKEYNTYSKASLMMAIRSHSVLKNKIYYDVFPCSSNIEIIRYVLRGKPLQIMQHKEPLMKEILSCKSMKGYIKLFKNITLYIPLGLPLTLGELCEWVIKADDLDSKGYKTSSKPNAIKLLSILMPTKNFIKTITPFTPTKGEIERYSDENKLHYTIQKAIASSLKLVNSPTEILPLVKSYAFGDYLKLVVGSLNSICLKVPEKKILPLLIEWVDCPMTLKKHFIRAYCKVAPAADSEKLLDSLLDKEENRSLRLVLLEQIYLHFLSEPCEERFLVFKAAYSRLTSEDVEALDRLFNLKKIPDLFVARFIAMLWEAAELKEGLLVSSNKSKIIKMIDSDVLCLLSEDFCDILLKYTFTIDCLSDSVSFITDYLLYAPDETTLVTRLDKIAKYVTQIVQNNWNDFNLNSSIVFKSKNNVFGLTQSICQESIEKEKLKICSASLLEKWKLFLLSLFSANEIVDELLFLESAIFISNNDTKKDGFISQLARFYEDLLSKYCSSYGDQIIASVVSFLPNCLEERRLQLAKVLLCEHKSYQVHLMALKLINTTITKDLSTYKVIIECLHKCTHPYVKCAAESFMRSLSSEVEFSED